MNELEPEKDGATPTPEPSKPPQRPERTEKEKAEFSLKKNAERLRELGGNPADILGVPKVPLGDEFPDDTPLTYGKLREIQKIDSQKTALQLAEEITDDFEREQIKILLQTRIVPSGNPLADLELARSAVNAKRTAKIAEEMKRKTEPNKNAPGGSSPPKKEDEFVPTPQEAVFMRHPYNVTKEKILAAREREAKKENKQ